MVPDVVVSRTPTELVADFDRVPPPSAVFDRIAQQVPENVRELLLSPQEFGKGLDLDLDSLEPSGGSQLRDHFGDDGGYGNRARGRPRTRRSNEISKTDQHPIRTDQVLPRKSDQLLPLSPPPSFEKSQCFAGSCQRIPEIMSDGTREELGLLCRSPEFAVPQVEGSVRDVQIADRDSNLLFEIVIENP
jgi:hypothetical protein